MARLSWRLVVMAGALLAGAGALVLFAVASATSSPSSEFDAPEPTATISLASAGLASAQLSPPADIEPTPTAEPAVEEPGHEHTPLPPPPVADPTATPTCDLVVIEANVPAYGLLDPTDPEAGVGEVSRTDYLRNPCTGEEFARDVETGEIRQFEPIYIGL